MLKVVCFKWNHRGGYKLPSAISHYTPDHVHRLQRATEKYLSLPHEFICITDDPEGLECKTLPLWDKCMDQGGCFNRLYVFSKDMRQLIGERFVCIDLDTVITGPLDELFGREEDFVINRFHASGVKRRYQFYNGAVIMMTAGARDKVWTEFAKDIPGNVQMVEQERNKGRLVGTDQAWIAHVLGPGEAVFDIPEVYPYLKLPLNRKGEGRVLDKKASIVNFSGTYDPSVQYYDNLWVQEYWDGQAYCRRDLMKQLRRIDMVEAETKKATKRNGYVPDLLNPVSLTEKLLHQKLFTHDARWIPYADKAKARDYVPEEYHVPVIMITEDPKDIPLGDQPLMLKPSNSSGRNIVYQPGMNKNEVRSRLQRALVSRYGTPSNEWFYLSVLPQVVVEPLLELDTPSDYKFYCIRGNVQFIHVVDSTLPGNPSAFYTTDWKRMPLQNKNTPSRTTKKPPELKEMIDLAERLSGKFPFVRIDLMRGTGGQIYFSEFTFYPNAGNMTFKPIKYDFQIGGIL